MLGLTWLTGSHSGTRIQGIRRKCLERLQSQVYGLRVLKNYSSAWDIRSKFMIQSMNECNSSIQQSSGLGPEGWDVAMILILGRKGQYWYSSGKKSCSGGSDSMKQGTVGIQYMELTGRSSSSGSRSGVPHSVDSGPWNDVTRW